MSKTPAVCACQSMRNWAGRHPSRPPHSEAIEHAVHSPPVCWPRRPSDGLDRRTKWYWTSVPRGYGTSCLGSQLRIGGPGQWLSLVEQDQVSCCAGRDESSRHYAGEGSSGPTSGLADYLLDALRWNSSSPLWSGPIADLPPGPGEPFKPVRCRATSHRTRRTSFRDGARQAPRPTSTASLLSRPQVPSPRPQQSSCDLERAVAKRHSRSTGLLESWQTQPTSSAPCGRDHDAKGTPDGISRLIWPLPLRFAAGCPEKPTPRPASGPCQRRRPARLQSTWACWSLTRQLS